MPLANKLGANDSGFEASIGGWVADTNTTVVRSTAAARTGTASMQLTATAGGTQKAKLATGSTGTDLTVIPSSRYLLSGWSRAAATPRQVQLIANWYNGASYISTSQTAGSTNATGSWTQETGYVTSPATATRVELQVQVLSSAAAEVQRFDDISLQYAQARITLTPDLPNSRVAVQLDDFGPTADDIGTTVYRVADSATDVLRPANPARTNAGTWFGYDYEMPVNTEFTYQAADDTGTIISGTLTMATTALWLKSPSTPAFNRRFRLSRVPVLERPRRSTVFEVIGRADPIVVSDVRSLSRGTLELVTLTDQEADDLYEFLDAVPVAYISVPNSRFGERYVHLGDATENPVSPKIGEPALRHSIAFTEVARPDAAVIGDLTSTYQLVKDTFATYQLAKNAHTSYLDLLNGVNTGA